MHITQLTVPYVENVQYESASVDSVLNNDRTGNGYVHYYRCEYFCIRWVSLSSYEYASTTSAILRLHVPVRVLHDHESMRWDCLTRTVAIAMTTGSGVFLT